jgi:hypothetical protein
MYTKGPRDKCDDMRVRVQHWWANQKNSMNGSDFRVNRSICGAFFEVHVCWCDEWRTGWEKGELNWLSLVPSLP